jgi:hypothetical protein
MKTEQCFCKSYSDDDHKIQDCTCGKCDTQEIQEWSEEFDKVWNYTVAPNKELVKSFISQKLKEQEERHKREIDNLLHSMLEREKIYSEDLKTIRSKYE